ncbi:hypothetical protein [Agrococcus sp. SGAir0287]|uniref:hypothetical protein n=1 Tax=Agrococcus sp. SGAir0287 TaxID=2070347 RepID=UPI0010CCF661|nr:hypothetical protein [Agrococcus sp. SGAir0287]QCR19731.1 hypothetical protein C1N71_10100 [Agrococcus sp. SGAir0287]
MNDDELRERLRAMPEPTTTIDVDAVVADARRRRRPKVVGVGVAAVAGCLAFLAPVVVPGLLGPDPVTSTLQEQGAAEQGDASGAPAAPAPAATSGGEPDASTFQSSAPEAAGGAQDACAPPTPAGEVVAGLGIAFSDDPADGDAALVLTNASPITIDVGVGEVGTIVLDGGLVATSTELDMDAATRPVAIGSGATVELPIDLARSTVACGYGPAGLAPSPLVVLDVGGARIVVAGTPFAS